MIWQASYPPDIAYRRHCELTSIVLRMVPNRHRHTIRMAFTELLSNAVKASKANGGEYVHMAWTLEGQQLRLELINEGVKFIPTAADKVMPDPTGEHLSGRGIPIAHLCSDTLDYLEHEYDVMATHVVATWNLAKLWSIA